VGIFGFEGILDEEMAGKVLKALKDALKGCASRRWRDERMTWVFLEESRLDLWLYDYEFFSFSVVVFQLQCLLAVYFFLHSR
jgi:hypothetical protein